MRRRQWWPTLLALTLLVAAGGAWYAQQEARRSAVQAAPVGICSQIPTLLGAVDFTLNVWPIADHPEVAPDTVSNLQYFTGAVRLDATWCETGPGDASPQVIADTLAWHFSNASVALLEYQQAVGAVPPMAERLRGREP